MSEEHSSNPTENELISETNRWLLKIQEIPVPVIENDFEKRSWENVQAYIEDAQFFKDKRDWVRAFEACIWAWAFYEVVFKFPKE